MTAVVPLKNITNEFFDNSANATAFVQIYLSPLIFRVEAH